MNVKYRLKRRTSSLHRLQASGVADHTPLYRYAEVSPSHHCETGIQEDKNIEPRSERNRRGYL